MSAATFRAHCAKGHDRIEFAGAEGAKAFEAHMMGEHKAKMYLPGSPHIYSRRPAPGWARGEIQSPTPWKAPAVPKDWETRLAAVLTAAGDDVIDGGELTVPDGVYRYDDETPEPPYRALPVNVRSILGAVVSRGELWAVTVKGDVIGLSVGRAVNDQAGMTVWRGKVQPKSTKLRRPQDHHGVISPKLSDVRAAFGPDWTPAIQEVVA